MTKWLFHLPIEVSRNLHNFEISLLKKRPHKSEIRFHFLGRKLCYEIKYFSFRENPNNFRENIFIATLVINDQNNPTQWTYSISVTINNRIHFKKTWIRNPVPKGLAKIGNAPICRVFVIFTLGGHTLFILVVLPLLTLSCYSKTPSLIAFSLS